MKWIVRKKHPFDDGYWARFDGMPRPMSGTFRRDTEGVQRPISQAEQDGWDQLDDELRLEAA